MRAVVQRVKRASVTVDSRVISSIGNGFLVLIGAGNGDGAEDADYIIKKLAGLRVFEDAEGKMNLSVKDVGGEILLVSQFTLYGDARHGRRPSFSNAALPETAEPMIEHIAAGIRNEGIEVKTGKFRAHMEVELLNDGPVTILLDSRKGF